MISLRYGCKDALSDRTLPLFSGKVKHPQLEISPVEVSSFDSLLARFLDSREFDVAETSLSTMTMLRAAGDDRFSMIPVFPSRAFRHRCVYLPESSTIRTPTGLRGRRVGLLHYEMTAAVWFRGLLEEEYGVPAEDVHWVEGSLAPAGGHTGRVAYGRHRPITVTKCDAGVSLVDALRDGLVDAVFSTIDPRPRAIEQGVRLKRLFEDWPQAEREYQAKTRMFPIMHVIAVHRDVVSAQPDVLTWLSEAFNSSINMMIERYADTDTPVSMYPWLAEGLFEQSADLGYVPYLGGIEQTQRELSKFLGYMYRQGLTSVELTTEELFGHPDPIAEP